MPQNPEGAMRTVCGQNRLPPLNRAHAPTSQQVRGRAAVGLVAKVLGAEGDAQRHPVGGVDEVHQGHEARPHGRDGQVGRDDGQQEDGPAVGVVGDGLVGWAHWHRN